MASTFKYGRNKTFKTCSLYFIYIFLATKEIHKEKYEKSKFVPSFHCFFSIKALI